MAHDDARPRYWRAWAWQRELVGERVGGSASGSATSSTASAAEWVGVRGLGELHRRRPQPALRVRMKYE